VSAAAGRPVLRLSGATGQGVREVLRALWREISASRAAEAEPEAGPWRP